MKPIIYFILSSVLLFTACKKPNQEQLDELVPEGKFESKQLKNMLEEYASDTNYMKRYRFGDTLSVFYADRSYKPVWAFYMISDSTAKPVLDRFYESRREGFKPSYYKHDSIISMLDRLHNDRKKELYNELAHLELLISDNMLSLHRDRVVGRTNPKEVFEGAYQLPLKQHDDFDLMTVLDYDRFGSVLQKNPYENDTAYNYLADLLQSYLVRLDNGEEWHSIDTVGIRKLEPGDTTNLMPEIAQKLAQLKVISEKEMIEADSFVYHKSFAKYIRRFQQRYGLYDDAILGRKTFGLLNQSIDDRINEIAANMERLRWFEFPKEEEDTTFVSVNLPAYELSLHYKDSIKRMAVCIGKARPHNYAEKKAKADKEGKYWLKPPDHETPQIYSKIAYMVVNPTWNVPRSIIRREMWWKMRRDSMYLANAGYGVYYKKKEIRSDSINWRRFKPNKLPFEIIQKSGDDNALGRVKFIFPNKFSIYLHDTPQRSKFKWTERAVSHGCVRIEDPVQMGEYLTQAIDTLDSDDFRIHMGLEPLDEERLEEYDPEDTTARIQPLLETRLIRLNKQVPVYFLYRTIWFDDDWNVLYRNDVYQKNRLIIEAMQF